MKRVVIVGSSPAAVRAALLLSEHQGLRVVLVTPRDTLEICPFDTMQDPTTDQKSTSLPLSDIFRTTTVRVVRDDVRGLDTTRRLVVGTWFSYEYDFVVLATEREAGKLVFDSGKITPKLIRTQRTLLSLRKKLHAEVTEHPRRHLNFAVVGNNRASVSLASYLSSYIGFVGMAHGIRATGVRIALCLDTQKLLEDASPKLRHTVVRELEKADVSVARPSVRLGSHGFLDVEDGTYAPDHVFTASLPEEPALLRRLAYLFTTDEQGTAVRDSLGRVSDGIFVVDDPHTLTAVHQARAVVDVICQSHYEKPGDIYLKKPRGIQIFPLPGTSKYVVRNDTFITGLLGERCGVKLERSLYRSFLSADAYGELKNTTIKDSFRCEFCEHARR